MIGRIHSLQSLGTVDGPGVRFVVFFQGCPLRCGFCHNPDTHRPDGGKEISAEEILSRILRCRSYFGEKGGVTLSGGEPLMQADFAQRLLSLCKDRGVHTCLDTSGCATEEAAQKVLSLCDRVLLDVKFTREEQYLRYTGASMKQVTDFLHRLNKMAIPTTLRQVILPGLNDDEDSLLRLRALRDAHSCVDQVELLPFRKVCQVKYDALGLPFPLGDLPCPSPEQMNAAKEYLERGD